MYRLIALLSCIAISINGIFAKSDDPIDEGTDAFEFTASGENLTSIEPALRIYFTNVALKIKQRLNTTSSEAPYSIKAHFDPSTKMLWKLDAIKNGDKTKLICLELVEKILKDSNPPTAQPFDVTFFIDNLPITKVESNGDIDYGPYMAMLQRTIKSNFYVTNKPTKSTKTTILFSLDKNGSIKHAHVTDSSGFPDYDKAAMKALNSSAPFLPLPFRSSDMSISYTFNYDSQCVGHLVGRNYVIHLAQPSVVTTIEPFHPKGNFRRF